MSNENNKNELQVLEKTAKKMGVNFMDERERLLKHLNKLNYKNYPDISDENFYKNLTNKKEFKDTTYDLVENEEKEKTYCPSDNSKFKLLNHQIFLKNYINIHTPYNGILMFHGLGSGKSCSAIGIAELYKENIKNGISNKILVLVSGNTIEQNFRQEIHNIKKGFNQCTFSEYINYKPHDKDKEKQDKVDALIDSFYEIFHYQKFTNLINKNYSNYSREEYRDWIEKTFSNRVIIVDEVHNLKFKDNEKDTFKRYDALREIVRLANNIKLILMSGTPMSHSPTEIIGLFNLLLLNDKYNPIDEEDYFNNNKKITEEGLQKLKYIARGYISYIRQENPLTFAKKEFSGDYIDTFIQKRFPYSKFGKDTTISREEYKLVFCPMEGEQLKNYLEYTKIKQINATELLQLGIFSYDPNKKKDIYKLSFSEFSEQNIKNHSMKLYKVLENLKHSTLSPIFIYSNYKERGILMLASMLLKNGIGLNKTIRSTDPILLSKKVFLEPRINPTAPICYRCFKTLSECKKDKLHEYFPFTFEYIIGDTPEETQEKILKLFNSDENFDGRKLKVLIGSSVLKEGISLKNTREVHLLEPWYNFSRIRQVIGRALRHCSHKDLPKKDRKVTIFQYASVLSDEPVKVSDEINEMIRNLDVYDEVPMELLKSSSESSALLSYDIATYKRASILDKEVNRIESVLKASSVDCILNKKLNIDTLPEGEQYHCNFIEYEKDLDEVLDTSTFNDIFLMPYINYAISVVKDKFQGKIFIRDSEIKVYDEFTSEEIYNEKESNIIQRALNILVPVGNNFSNFPHIFKGGKFNKFGYVFVRQDKQENIYIFQELDTEEKLRSINENIPLYERIKEIPSANVSSLELYLKILEREEKKSHKNTYNDILNKKITYEETTDEKGTAKKVEEKVAESKTGSIAMKTIKDRDPRKLHTNDGDVVGIEINEEIFGNKLWLRISKQNIGVDNDKKYQFGKETLSFDRKELVNIIETLWIKIQEIGDEKIISQFSKQVNEVIKGIIRKKPLKQEIIREMLLYLNKIGPKTWHKKL